MWLGFIDIRKGQKTNNGQSLRYFSPHMSFWSCIESTNNKQNMEMRPCTEGGNEGFARYLYFLQILPTI